jgi:hypothetical protein
MRFSVGCGASEAQTGSVRCSDTTRIRAHTESRTYGDFWVIPCAASRFVRILPRHTTPSPRDHRNTHEVANCEQPARWDLVRHSRSHLRSHEFSFATGTQEKAESTLASSAHYFSFLTPSVRKIHTSQAFWLRPKAAPSSSRFKK